MAFWSCGFTDSDAVECHSWCSSPSCPCTLCQAAHQSCLCTGEGTGQDRVAVTQVWAPSPVRWRPAGCRQCWEQAVWVLRVQGGCSTCVLWLGSCRVPRLPYMSCGEGEAWQLKWKGEVLWTLPAERLGVSHSSAGFFGWAMFGFGFVFSFLSTPPPPSLPPCFLTARFLLAWATLVPHRDWRHHFPQAGGVQEQWHHPRLGEVRERWPCGHNQGPLCKCIVTWTLNHVLLLLSGP